MKTWLKSVWVKRLVPLALLVVVWFGVTRWQTFQNNRARREEERIGAVIAKVWLGSATYRKSPDQFIAYRDSVLKADKVTRDDINAYISNHSGQTDLYFDFAKVIGGKVDSLYAIQDSIVRARPHDTPVVKQQPKIGNRKRMGTVPVSPAGK